MVCEGRAAAKRPLALLREGSTIETKSRSCGGASDALRSVCLGPPLARHFVPRCPPDSGGLKAASRQLP